MSGRERREVGGREGRWEGEKGGGRGTKERREDHFKNTLPSHIQNPLSIYILPNKIH